MNIATIDPVPRVPLLAEAGSEKIRRERVEAFLTAVRLLSLQLGVSIPQMNDGIATIEAGLAHADAVADVSQQLYELMIAASTSEATGTSASSVSVGPGAKTFAASAGKIWWPKQTLYLRSAASPANYMVGVVDSYDPMTGALAVTVFTAGGSGTFGSWLIYAGGPREMDRASYEAIGPLVPTNTGSAWTWLNIPQTYNDLLFEMSGVSTLGGSGILTIQGSTDNGASWSAAAALNSAASGNYSGAIRIHNYRGAKPAAENLYLSGSGGLAALAGPLNAIRLGWNNSAAGTGGTIQLKGI